MQDVSIAQANFSIATTNHYFQLEILNAGVGVAIATGLAKTSYPLHRHPGWNSGGARYQSDTDTWKATLNDKNESDIEQEEFEQCFEGYSEDDDDYSNDDMDFMPLPRRALLHKQKSQPEPSSGHKEGQACTVYFTKNEEEVGEVECTVPNCTK